MKIKMKPFSKQRPRVTRNGTYMNKGYIESKKLLKSLILASSYRNIDLKGKPLHIELVFCFKIPKSWTKKMKANPDNKRIVQDIDNLTGGVFDALNGVLWNDDRDIVSVCAKKQYCEEDSISIKLTEIQI